MGGIFGKEKKGSRITEHDKAILNLKKQRDQLKQYQKKISGVLEKDRLLAKKLLSEGKTDRAKLLLRKKKYQEGLLNKTEKQLDNIERLTQDLEFTQVEKQVIDGLKIGNDALKKANDMFSIEEIEAILDDTKEAIDKQREIDALLSGQLSPEDEEDVFRELDELVAEEDAARLPEVPKDTIKETDKISLPDVPSADPLPDKKPSKKIALEAS